MNITIQTKSGVAIYEQIGQQLKEEIIAGRLKEGEPLPSIRSLARDLKISVITTKRAYEELEKEGMIYSVPGKGFFVDNPAVDYLAEKRMQGMEEALAEVLRRYREEGYSIQEIKELIDILWEESI